MIRSLGVPHPTEVTCPHCDGDATRPVQVGRMSPPEDSECPRCEGRGAVAWDDLTASEQDAHQEEAA